MADTAQKLSDGEMGRRTYYNKQVIVFVGAPYGIRTRVTALRGELDESHDKWR
jgi:hypothetical protein